MAILGGTPISAVPISGLEAAAAAATDDAIKPQMTATDDGTTLHGDAEFDAYDSSDAQLGSPLHDIVAVADAEVKIFWGFFEPGTDEDAENWTPDWAQAPPTDQFDETGQTRGQVSNNDWVDEDEPVADGWFSTPPTFEEFASNSALMGEVFDDDEPIVEFWTATPTATPADETGETTASSSNLDWVDEHEDLTEGSYLGPLEDTTVVVDDSFLGTTILEVTDEDEPIADDWVQAPLADAPAVATVDDVGPQELGQVWEDDEPEVVGTFASPSEESQDDTDILGRSIEDLVDDDEPLSDGWLSAPLEDAPVALNSDITGTLLGEVFDDDEPVTDGWFSAPLENAPGLNDDLTGHSFPDDTDLEGEGFHPDFFAGFLASPLEDTPSQPPAVEEDRGKSGKRVYEDYDPYYYKRRNKRRTTKDDIEAFLAEAANAPVQTLPVDLAAQHEAARVAAQEALTLALAKSTKIALKEINAFYSLLREAIKLRKAQQELEDDEDEDVLLLISAELF